MPQKRFLAKLTGTIAPAAFFHAKTFKKSRQRANNKTTGCIILAQTGCELLPQIGIFRKS